MAANKFATALHRSTNKITLILVYAILEWVLILLLLLNSLFSYLIIKFADYFGLKRPCLWCSRLDHIFEPSKFQNSYRSLVCEAHAIEISKLGYCCDHGKLAESEDMCEDCSSSLRNELFNKFAFFPWMKQIGVVQQIEGGNESDGNSEVSLKCSCCGVVLDTKLSHPDYYLIKPSWRDSDYTEKGNLVLEPLIDVDFDEVDHSQRDRSGFRDDHGMGEKREEERGEGYCQFVYNFDGKEMVADDGEKADMVVKQEEESIKKDDLNVAVDDPSLDQIMTGQANSSKDQIQPRHLEFYIDQEDCHLIPIEMMDSIASEKQIPKEGNENCSNEDFVLEFDNHVRAEYELVVEEKNSLEEEEPLLSFSAHESEEEPKVVLDSRNFAENESSSGVFADWEFLKEEAEEVAIVQEPQISAAGGNDVQESSEAEGSEGLIRMHSDELDGDISIGTDIPDQEQIDDIQTEDVPSTSTEDNHGFDGHGSEQAEEGLLEFRTTTIETSERVMNKDSPLCLESNEVEEDKIPDTPTSIDSLHHLDKKLLLLDRKESTTEESLDGSVMSDIEAGDGILTVEKLKSALRSERKALNALYAELEEERNASAVAASQTMAMINRLQEEKAAMQMEALQYQRMMEEQSEYDQEALQLLNELMVKREKEKAEVEKELEVYRKKVQDFEAKERMVMLNRGRDGNGSTRSGTCSPSAASSSNAEESDGLSVDLNLDGKEQEIVDKHQESSNQNTPEDAVIYLEESLASFEEERLSILEQLKVLEEKLTTLSDEEEQDFENGNGYSGDFHYNSEANGVANGHHKAEMNGKYHHHQERKHIGAKAKRLLPLFDAIDAESEDGMLNGQEESMNKFEIDSKKLAIEEEVDHVYDRLQALEADREFLKHCITSLRKGDKGLELLQEILHHLRDLRSVELRARNIGDVGVE